MNRLSGLGRNLAAPISPRRRISSAHHGSAKLLQANRKKGPQSDDSLCSQKSISVDDLVALGWLFCKSRVLHAAMDLDLFTIVAKNGGSLSFVELQELFGLHERARDFLDALVSLHLLDRDGPDGGETGTCTYSNSESSQAYLVRGSDTYIGDLLENCSSLYESFININDPNIRLVNVGTLMERIMSAAKVRTARSAYEGSLSVVSDDTSTISGLSDDATDVTVTESSDFAYESIIQLAFGFGPSRMLHLANELRIFPMLAAAEGGKVSAKQMGKLLGTDESRLKECLRTLAGFKVLEMKMERNEMMFGMTPVASKYLDPSQQTYIGGVFLMCGSYEFRNWGSLTSSLKTGAAACNSFPDFAMREGYVSYLCSRSNIYAPSFTTFAKEFDFSNYKSFLEWGGAVGQLACAVAQENKRMRCISVNCKSVTLLAERRIRDCEMDGRVRVHSVAHENLLADDELPKADIIAMAQVLIEKDVKEKKALIKKAFTSLPKEGALVVIESSIDDQRRTDTHALCKSLTQLLATGETGGCNYTPRDLQQWCLEVGFTRFDKLSLGSCSAVIAYK